MTSPGTAHLGQADTNQARASDPVGSAWVSANAGTGKTAVLVKRVLRLLLAGSRAESILCLTYTKTAAAEMQNRVLERLAQWATMASEELRAELAALLGGAPGETDLKTARRLFARALEAKGGLKIHTIHGFCERLLQRFPLEARITPHFTVLDEGRAALLKRAAFDDAIERAADAPDSPLGKALTRAIMVTSDDYFRKVVETAIAKRAELDSLVTYYEGLADWHEAETRALKHLFGVADDDEGSLTGAMARVLSDAEIDTLVATLAEFERCLTKDRDTETGLRAARSHSGDRRAAALDPIFLTSGGSPRKELCGAAFRDAHPEIAGMLCEAQTLYASLAGRLAHLRVAEASGAVLAFADAVQDEYARRKRAEAALDYDDLITKAQHLLFRAGAAAWVLYKIDGGVDHILVDEAQDTNPAQWTIVERLAEEFFAGEGASETLRTLFAVGDEKQSIYSFQGADPTRFGHVGRSFRQRALTQGLAWNDVPLNVSFRSTVPVLEAVDAVFARPDAAQGLIFAETTLIEHYAHRQDEAGLVEIWDVEQDAKPEPAEPFEPWNEEVSGAGSVDRLCRRIARLIKSWLDDEEILASQGRQVTAGDILILVRRRDPFMTPMIRALKRERIPVAGADRMRLINQLAIQDLVALADVLLMPEDDLALAVVLKSPLFNLDDDALFAVAHGRSGSLWSALKSKAREDDRFAEPASQLSDWLSRVDMMAPYEFFSGLLGAEEQKLRKHMLTRLGPEAAEAIDEFLDLALAYDREAAPSLQGFVDQLRLGEIEIKRDMEQDRDEVRIMTVHGAKGLQAPIVFLPDTCMGPRAQNPRLFLWPRRDASPDTASHVAWAPKGFSGIDGLSGAKAAGDQADREEYNRLLYVAMTRARDRLYVCGWTGQKRPPDKCWYQLIDDGLKGRLTEIAISDEIKVRRMESAQDKPPSSAGAGRAAAAPSPLPDWAHAPAPPERSRKRLTPSRLGLGLGQGIDIGFEQAPLGPITLSDNARYARGRLVHALLQHLPDVPPSARVRAARAFVAARGTELTQDLKDEIVAETLALVSDERFAALFGPGSLAEVPVVADLGNDVDVEGQIDRLVLDGSDLIIADYKTNRPPRETPDQVAPAYIAQLAAYRAALRRLFPEHNLRAALIWTDGPSLMEIPSTLLDAAERRIFGPPP